MKPYRSALPLLAAGIELSALLTFGVSSARASLVASDSFDTYTAGAALGGDNGGTGWSGAYTSTLAGGEDDQCRFRRAELHRRQPQHQWRHASGLHRDGHNKLRKRQPDHPAIHPDANGNRTLVQLPLPAGGAGDAPPRCAQGGKHPGGHALVVVRRS